MSALDSNNASVVREEVRQVAVETINLLGALFNAIVSRLDSTDGIWTRLHCLTVYALELINEYYEGAFVLHQQDLPHAAAILERSIFETLVQLRAWYDDETGAAKDWRMLPVAVYKEQLDRVGGDKSILAPKVQAQYESYLRENPDLPKEPTRKQFKRMARKTLLNAGWDEQTFRDAFFKFYDVPSLFTHARPHGAEDIFGVDDQGTWVVSDQHRYTEANAQILSSTGLALQCAREIAIRYALPMEPIESVNSLWDGALAQQP